MVYFGRAARRVVVSGVWPLSLIWYPCKHILNEGI